MLRMCLLAFALAGLITVASAQSTPAPCSPSNIQYTYNLLGCFDSVDCSSGYECVYMQVGTDVVYGTTCNEVPVSYCAYPGPGGPTVPPGASNERKDHAKVILASVRARNRS